eukprot:TRINITY_DN5266_c0_g1_i3.p1 TRINITY_DN5266_c0_g1~~TRINITY_DN5266_c0_g1_i3.p1  ORF type:complete len:499 (+),score=85.75 TRINITY_DN5266_c0_g1_i3:154-1650(+)
MDCWFDYNPSYKTVSSLDPILWSAPEIQGPLSKRGHIRKNWKSRWFRLQNALLFYFETRDTSTPIGCIKLKFYFFKQLWTGEKPHSFSLLGTTVEYPDFHFSALDAGNAVLWSSHLSQYANTPLKSFLDWTQSHRSSKALISPLESSDKGGTSLDISGTLPDVHFANFDIPLVKPDTKEKLGESRGFRSSNERHTANIDELLNTNLIEVVSPSSFIPPDMKGHKKVSVNPVNQPVRTAVADGVTGGGVGGGVGGGIGGVVGGIGGGIGGGVVGGEVEDSTFPAVQKPPQVDISKTSEAPKDNSNLTALREKENNRLLNLMSKYISNEDPHLVFNITNHSIGKGSVGEVFFATDRSNGNKVAIKKLQLMRRGKDRTTTILREIEIIATSQHHNIVKYLGSYLVIHELWVVMEYVEGGNLYDFLKLGEEKKISFSEEHVSYIIHETVLAIAFLHSLDRIHRDIKVDNILLSVNGDVKLADFGTAVQLSRERLQRTTLHQS